MSAETVIGDGEFDDGTDVARGAFPPGEGECAVGGSCVGAPIPARQVFVGVCVVVPVEQCVSIGVGGEDVVIARGVAGGELDCGVW